MIQGEFYKGQRIKVSQIVKLSRDSISVAIGHAKLSEFGGVDFRGFKFWRQSTKEN